jgi:hypothetical protein
MDKAKRQKLTKPQRTPFANLWLEPQEGRAQLVVFNTLASILSFVISLAASLTVLLCRR